MLICGDWYNWSHFRFISPVTPDKAVFVSAVMLCVQRYRVSRYFYPPKATLSCKEIIRVFIRINVKRPTSGRQYANVSC